MPTRNVNLTEHFDRFIKSGVASGRYSNASEVVREGLRLLEQRERQDAARIEWLSAAANEGFDAIEKGDYVTLDREEDLDAFLEEAYRQAAASVGQKRPKRRDG